MNFPMWVILLITPPAVIMASMHFRVKHKNVKIILQSLVSFMVYYKKSVNEKIVKHNYIHVACT